MKRFLASRLMCGVGAVAVVCLAAATAHADPVVTSGSDPTAELKGAVRFRALNNTGNQQVHVGVSSGGGVDSPTTGNVTWGAGTPVSFAYNASTGALTVTASSTSVTKVLGNLNGLNYLEITIHRNVSATLNLSDVSLQTTGTHALGTFVGSGSPTRWSVTGEDLTDGFTVTARLDRDGSFGGGDSSYVQIDVGYVAPPDPPGPVDVWGPETLDVKVEPAPVILNGVATVTATVDDTNAGGSPIQSAHYQLGPAGPFVAMSPSSGTFGVDLTVDVEATFLATDIGTHEVCVHGTDALNNEGVPTCQTFLVTYQFDGFFRPIETELVNVAKAGQAVPVKWRLTDAEGAPIDDPASFAGLFSYPVACADFAGSPADAVEEDAPGSSGLQWLGGGDWQFNWKTPKEYANTCRTMYVQFNSGAISPAVRFAFKK